jgi:hypothetical protein
MNASSFVLLAVRLLQPYGARNLRLLPSVERIEPHAVLPFRRGAPNALEREAMRTWFRSVVDTILGRVPGKTSRLDTATRMVMDADFSDRHPSMPRALPRERDDGHLIKPIGPSADRALFEQLVRIVNEAQERDAEDERRLYDPVPGAWPSLSQRGRLDPGSRF